MKIQDDFPLRHTTPTILVLRLVDLSLILTPDKKLPYGNSSEVLLLRKRSKHVEFNNRRKAVFAPTENIPHLEKARSDRTIESPGKTTPA